METKDCENVSPSTFNEVFGRGCGCPHAGVRVCVCVCVRVRNLQNPTYLDEQTHAKEEQEKKAVAAPCDTSSLSRGVR